jgi:hypothetical protein
MAGHSRSKNGVAALAYVPAIHALVGTRKTWMRGTSPRTTVQKISRSCRRDKLTAQPASA